MFLFSFSDERYIKGATAMGIRRTVSGIGRQSRMCSIDFNEVIRIFGRHIDTILKVAKTFNVPVDIITC